MFANKHVVIALLVAPLLAILAWYITGLWVGEKPEAARSGQSYPLVEQSNCRYESGRCDLRNGDMHLAVTLAETTSSGRLVLAAGIDLDSAFMAMGSGDARERTGAALAPIAMQRLDESGRQWAFGLPAVPSLEQRLYLVVNAGGARWYGEFSTAFMQQPRSARREAER